VSVAQLIKSTGEVTTVAIPKKDSLPIMQLAVGGLIEYVRCRYNGKKADMVVNEEGRLIGLPINPIASLIAGQTIVGDVLLLAKSM
jgi:hypothetical protein